MGHHYEIQALIKERLKPAFPELIECRSHAELERHPRYRELASSFDTALASLTTGDFLQDAPPKPRYRFVAWNIERGTQLEGQLREFRNHDYLKHADVLLLTELDVGMARSANVDVPDAIARELGMAYAFAPCYLSFVKGSGVERHVAGENEVGLHGNAILSRYPIRHVRTVRLENGIDKIAANEKRLGRQTAVIAEIAFPNETVTAASVHLDAQSSQCHRRDQMQQVLDVVGDAPRAVLGGDWNTSTYNSSRATLAILGFWLRVMMGVDHVIRNHYLHPERYFERELFDLLKKRGFEFEKSNVMGEYTTYYSVDEPRANGSLREWVPEWCFSFIRWSLRNHGGRCPFKLDWMATRGLTVERPTVVHDCREPGAAPLSDHDAVGVDILA
jgi:endonuclease/exonuclease/phosphatase family metal-dependent hydrolase